MKLYYSLGGIERNWLSDSSGFDQFRNKHVRVVSQHPHFQFVRPAKLLVSIRPTGEGHVTILGELRTGTTPPTNKPPSTTAWEDVPSSPIYTQVRLALDSDAIRSLKPANQVDYDFELHIPARVQVERRQT